MHADEIRFVSIRSRGVPASAQRSTESDCAQPAHRHGEWTSVMASVELVSIWERDLWLARAVHQLRPVIEACGLRLPSLVTVKAGLTHDSAGGSQHALGECWPSRTTSFGAPGIVINRCVHDGVTVLAVLVHELIHAAADCQDGHGEWFKAWARAIGLEGPVPSTHAGPRLRRQLQAINRGLGGYPGARFGFSMTSAGGLVA
jgi:SprT-like family